MPWLVHRRFDLFFVVNVTWPLLAVAFFATEGLPFRRALDYYGVFLLAIPHRTITLGLVFFDRARGPGGATPFLLVGAAVALGYAGLFAAGGTALVLFVKYAWDVWHGASQHYGVFRLYERKAEPGRTPDPVLKWLLLAFILYAYLRAGATAGFARNQRWLADAASALPFSWNVVDLAALCLPSLAAWRARFNAASGAYFWSVCLGAAALLLAAHAGHPGWVVAIAFANGVFHATEYLAVVTWAETGKALGDRDDFWAFLVERWALSLGVFLAGLAVLGWAMSSIYANAWLVVVTLVSFLHYAYDGMIWKRARAAPRHSARLSPA